MKKSLLTIAMLSLFTPSVALADECIELKEDLLYAINSGKGVCFKTNLMKPEIYFDKYNLNMYEISSSQEYQIAFPHHIYQSNHAFKINAYGDFYIVRVGDNVLVMDKEQHAMSYNAGATVVGTAIAAGGSATITGGNVTSATAGATVGAGVGVIVGGVGGAVIGTAVGGIVSGTIDNLKDKPGSGVVSGTVNHGSNGGSCRGCHLM